MKQKNIVLGILGIILLIIVAFFVANIIHNANQKSIEKATESKEEDKFRVDGEKIEFKTYCVDQSFFINVPNNFVMLDEITLKSKYNYNNRPELVFMSSDDIEHIFISTTNESMTDEGLENYLNSRISNLTGMTLLDKGVYNKYGKTFAKLITTDSNTYYNIRFFTFNDKLVSVEFNLPVGIYQEWEEVINEVMDSICFDEENIKKYSSG